jgi:hypothetical protein
MNGHQSSSAPLSDFAESCENKLGLTEVLEVDRVEGPPSEGVSLTHDLIVSASFKVGTENKRAEVVAPQQHPSPDIKTRPENWSYERK